MPGPEINQDPMHTPHPVVEHPFTEALDRTLIKLARDLIANCIIVAPMLLVNGTVDFKLFLPALGIAVWRTVRDVIPAYIQGVGK